MRQFAQKYFRHGEKEAAFIVGLGFSCPLEVLIDPRAMFLESAH